jgi:hypothetical protein
LKRLAFAFLGALLFLSSIFAYLKSHFVLAVSAAAALTALMMWGAKLDARSEKNKSEDRAKKRELESQWSGAELTVKPRMFRRLLLILVWLGLFEICRKPIVYFQVANPTDAAQLLALVFVAILLAYFAWLTIAGLVREIQAGYCIKVTGDGFALAGYPTLPWRAVLRAGHSSSEHRGITHNFLELELDPVEVHRHWPSKAQPFVLGPFALGFSRFRMTGRVKLLGLLIALPMPTIATAIQKIGSRHGPNPVVELNEFESLDDARQLALLSEKILKPLDGSEQANAFKQAAAVFSKPGGTLDSNDLDKAMAKMDQDLSERSEAFAQYSELQHKVSTQRLTRFRDQIDRDMKWFPRVFGGVFAFLLLFYFLKFWLA